MSKSRNIYDFFFANSNKDFTFKKSIFLILLIKLPLFIFYSICFHLYPEVSIKHGLFYVVGGDTFTYYPPLINLLNGNDYGNACRMPGLILPFAPFYFIFKNQDLSFNLVIVFQFILSTLSVYVLGLITNILFNNNHRIFLFTIVMYSFWYHIGDHYMLADSIANSTLIFSVYFFLVSLNESFNNKKHIFYSGAFFTWSIFARLIAIVPFILLCFLLFYFLIVKKKEIIKFFEVALLFTSCFIICESAWIIRNKISLNRVVLFTELEECYSSFSYNWRELNKIPTGWAYNTTKWENEIDWWLDNNATAKYFPYPKNCFTKSFNADSLTKLKNEYWLLQEKEPLKLNRNFKNKVALYLREYASENLFNYYFLNPIKLFIKFHYKKRIDGVPFPALQKMNLFQKIFKAINWIFILTISMLFLVSPLFLYTNRSKSYFVFLLIPFSMSAFLVFYGAIEQRYFWAIIPFCIVFFSYLSDYLLAKFKSNKW